MPPGDLVDAVQTAHPKLQVWYMEYPNEAGHTALLAAVARNDPATGKPFKERNQVFYLGGHAYRLNFDLHRAGGLWLWLLLLPIAVSSVAMNLPSQVFKPAVSLFSPIEPSVYKARGRMPPADLGVTQLSYQQAYERGIRGWKKVRADRGN